MKLQQVLALPLGVLAILISVAMNKFLPKTNFNDFMQGLILGIGAVLAIYNIIVTTKKFKKG